MNQHLCLETQGKSRDCQTCSVSQAGHLNDFLKILEIKTNELKRKNLLDDCEREDIISEFVFKVHHQVNQFRGIGKDGIRPVLFRTWARTIYHGVYADYCRKKLGKKVQSDTGDDTAEPRLRYVDIEDLSNIPAENDDSRSNSRLIMGALQRLMQDEKTKAFCQILIDHFEWQQQNLSQEEMAQRYGLSHDNFRQKLSRARKHVKKAMGMENGQYS